MGTLGERGGDAITRLGGRIHVIRQLDGRTVQPPVIFGVTVNKTESFTGQMKRRRAVPPGQPAPVVGRISAGADGQTPGIDVFIDRITSRG